MDFKEHIFENIFSRTKRRLLRFFFQGLNVDLSEYVFPTLPNVGVSKYLKDQTWIFSDFFKGPKGDFQGQNLKF